MAAEAAPPRPPAGAAGGHRFPRANRVRRKAEFQQVFDRCTRIHSRFLTLLLLPTRHPAPRLGIVASRKLGGAVERNRAKRLIRELFRREVPKQGGRSVDLVVIPRRELIAAPFSSLTDDFRTAWRRGLNRIPPSHDRA